MARSRQTVNTPILGMLTVYTSANIAVTGLTGANFTKYISLSGVDQSTTITVTEVGNGRYMYSFTPTVVGYWHLLFTNATYNPRGWQDEFDVIA